METIDRNFLTEKARQIRKMTIDSIGYLGVGHIGGAMSVVEVLTVLNYKYISHDADDPTNPDRDRLVLSKGHAGPTLYSILADQEFFPADWLHTLNVGGTHLPSHCDRNLTPGIDMTTGSLGQGLSAAVGIALGNRLDQIDRYVYCLIGDGETNEGQNWEAAMAAARFNLNKLIAFTDYNKLQLDGFMDEIMPIDDLDAKWASFGWNVLRADGHDVQAIDLCIAQAQQETTRPSMIILDTIKGKGVDFAENRSDNHNMKIDYQTALDVINRI